MDVQQNQTFLTEGKPPPEELAEDDLGDLQALVSGVTQTSQSTLLLKKRKQMREVDDALEFMNEEYKARVAECERGQLEFERKQVDMKKMVAQFQQFITENDAKQRRAEIKAKTEAEQREKLEEQIKQLQKQELELMAKTKALNEQLASVRKYEKYLLEVVREANDEYNEISEVVNRYATLEQANGDLTKQRDDSNALIEKTRLALVQLRQDQQNRILVMNGSVQSSQKLIESLRAECSTLDIEKESKERYTKDRTMEYGAVVMSIKNLHSRCQTSYLTKTTGSSSSKEKGGPVLKYLTMCLDSMGRRILSLLETRDGYETWKAEGGVVDDGAGPRETKTPVRAPRTGGKSSGAKSGRHHRGRMSTTSSASLASGRLPRTSSDASAAGFRSDSQRKGAPTKHRRRGSDGSSNYSSHK